MESLEQLRQNLAEIQRKIDYKFFNPAFLELSFIHCSYVNENRELSLEHNERLEFLGDMVLGLIISDFLYRRYPQKAEGELSYLRSRLVEAASCSYYVQKIKLESYLLLGKGESMNKGKGRYTILADFFEALIGAIYLDGKIDEASRFFFSHFQEDILKIIESPYQNWKAMLQDFCQKNYQKPPTYEVIREEGPPHEKIFFVAVKIENIFLGEGVGSSKKEAEQDGAQKAIKGLGLR